MKTLIKNATLISMESEIPQKEDNMDILIQDNKITKIDKKIDESVDKVIDANNNIIMPGFINTHAHIPMSIFRETVDGYVLQDWLEKKIWPIEAKLTGEDIYKASLMSFDEMIKTGTTTVEEQYFETEYIIKAAEKKGVRLVTTRTLMDIDGKGEERYDELVFLLEKYKNFGSRITIDVGIHGLYTSTPSYVKKATDLARKYKKNIQIHFCENKKEVEDIKRIHNVEYPSEILEKNFEGLNVNLAHCVELMPKDMEVIKMHKMSITHCPISNLKLGCGIAKIQEMLNMGINVSLGTDGQGSGSNLDMFETMKFAALLQKGVFCEPIFMPAYEVLKMATINGAKTLKKENEIGSIKVGKNADIIMINLEGPTINPVNDVFADIVYNAKGSNVVMTMVDGKILL